MESWLRISDITDELKAREQLEVERIKGIKMSKLASLGELSAGVAHEINNPLTVIHAAARSFASYANDPAKISAKFVAIEAASTRIAKIVRGLEKFSRSSDKASVAPRSIAAIAREAIILTDSKAKRHDTLVSVDVKSPGMILCDEIEIEQVLVNLLSNAIDAVKNLAERWVKISVFESGSSVLVRVCDAGKGIGSDVEHRLFEPFFTTKPVGEGTGIGLSIAKGILDEHNATIRFSPAKKTPVLNCV